MFSRRQCALFVLAPFVLSQCGGGALAGSYSVSNSATTYLQANGYFGTFPGPPEEYFGDYDAQFTQTTSFNIPKFNHSLGTLTSATVSLRSAGSYDWTIDWDLNPSESIDSGAEGIGWYHEVASRLDIPDISYAEVVCNPGDRASGDDTYDLYMGEDGRLPPTTRIWKDTLVTTKRGHGHSVGSATSLRLTTTEATFR